VLIARDRAELPIIQRRLKAFTKLLALLNETPNSMFGPKCVHD